MALISEYLAADSSPDVSADALAIINNSIIRSNHIPLKLIYWNSIIHIVLLLHPAWTEASNNPLSSSITSSQSSPWHLIHAEDPAYHTGPACKTCQALEKPADKLLVIFMICCVLLCSSSIITIHACLGFTSNCPVTAHCTTVVQLSTRVLAYW